MEELHKLNKNKIYTAYVTLRTTSRKTPGKEITHKIYGCPWLVLADHVMNLAEITDEYTEHLEYNAYDTRCIYQVIVYKGNNLVQIIELNRRMITKAQVEKINSLEEVE